MDLKVIKEKLNKWVFDKDGELSLRNAPKWLFGSVIVLFLLFFISSLIFGNFGADATTGAFGDSFGPLTSLFSGLAFAGLIYTVLLQRQELKLQRIELEDSRKEFIYNRHVELVYRETSDLLQLGSELSYLFDAKRYDLSTALAFVDSRADVNFKNFVKNNLESLAQFYKRMYVSLSQIQSIVNQDVNDGKLVLDDLKKIEYLYFIRNRIFSDYACEIKKVEGILDISLDSELGLYCNLLAMRMKELKVSFDNPNSLNI